MNWEYKLIILEMTINQDLELENLKKDNQELNKLGLLGWELVNIIEIYESSIIAYFKRELI